MDFSKFGFHATYKNGYKLFFDFDIQLYAGHKRKTFEGYKSLIYFLAKNRNKRLYLTKNKVEDFSEDGDNLVINLEQYQKFCKSIGRNGENRAQAYLSRRIKHYTDEEEKVIITKAGDEQILDWIRALPMDKKQNFSYKLKQVDGIQVPPDTLLDEADFSNMLSLALTEPEKLKILTQKYPFPQAQAQILEEYKCFLEKTLERIDLEKDKKDDAWETYLRDWLNAKIDNDGKICSKEKKLMEKDARSRHLIFGLEFIDHKIEVLDAGQRMDVLTRINPDFGGREYVLIELKSPKAKIFDNEKKELNISQKLARAIPQVLEYKSDFETKVDGDKDLDRHKLKSGKIIKCIIVIGTTKEDDRWKKVFLSLKLSFSNLIEIWTYTDLIQRLGTTIKNLKENL
ncbi:MAG: DUF4263 domain-containing protein [Patescibacteria group bacterium]|nr:DUF4263 domain-containing protein [Patescibacteria group bacterium]